MNITWPAWVIFESEDFVRRVARESFGREISEDDVRALARSLRGTLAKARLKKK